MSRPYLRIIPRRLLHTRLRERAEERAKGQHMNIRCSEKHTGWSCAGEDEQRRGRQAHQRRAPGACSFGWVLCVSGMFDLQAERQHSRRAQRKRSQRRWRRLPGGDSSPVAGERSILMAGWYGRQHKATVHDRAALCRRASQGAAREGTGPCLKERVLALQTPVCSDTWAAVTFRASKTCGL